MNNDRSSGAGIQVDSKETGKHQLVTIHMLSVSSLVPADRETAIGSRAVVLSVELKAREMKGKINCSRDNCGRSWAQWHTFVIPALRRMKNEDDEFKANPSYISSLGPACAT